MSRTGIVLSATAEVFAARRRGTPLCTLRAGHRLTVTERSRKWCGVDVTVGDAGGPRAVQGFVDGGCLAFADADGRGYLAGDEGLQAAGVEAAGEARLTGSGAVEAAVSRAWNLYGGLLAVLAGRIGIDPAFAVAVVCVESGGQAFAPDGRVIIRFENHIFRRYLGAARAGEFDRHFQVNGPEAWMGHTYRRSGAEAFRPFHGSQALEWEAFEVARVLDGDAAARSISVGLPQVMGFNHGLLGYATPQAMLAFMGADVRFQLLGMFDFIGGPGGGGQGAQALRAGDFDRFATLYNGPGQARFYGDLIDQHVRAFRRLRPGSASTAASTAGSASSSTTNSTTGSSSGSSSGGSGTASGPTGRGAAAGGRTYEVQPGDTLGAIAGRFGVLLADLVALNEVANADLIHPGQVLAIPAGEPPPPPPVVPSAPPEDVVVVPAAAEDAPADGEVVPLDGHLYVVRPGDTLSAIAVRAETTVAQLVEANGIVDADLIFPGQLIRTPHPVRE